MGNSCVAEKTSCLNQMKKNNNNELLLKELFPGNQEELEDIRNELQESQIIAENLLTEHAEIVDILANSEDLRKRLVLDFP